MIYENSYIQGKSLYGYELVTLRAAKQSELKDAASSTEGITRSSVKLFTLKNKRIVA